MAVPALALALTVVLVWLHVLAKHTTLTLLPVHDGASSRLRLLFPLLEWMPLLGPVVATALAHYALPLERLVPVAPGGGVPSLLASLTASWLLAWLACATARITRAIHSAPLRLPPHPAVLLGTLLPPSPPLLALPLLRGVHRAALCDANALFEDVLSARVADAVLWGRVLSYAVARVGAKEALVRHWARGVAPVPAATGVGAWLVRPVDPCVGTADVPELLLWIRCVTLLIQRSLHHDRSGVFTAHYSLEVWLGALCRLYHVLQAYLGVRSMPAPTHPGYTPSPDDARHLVVRGGDEWHGIFHARADAPTVPLAQPKGREQREAMRQGPIALRDECRLCVYRLLSTFEEYLDQFDPATLAVVETFRRSRE